MILEFPEFKGVQYALAAGESGELITVKLSNKEEKVHRFSEFRLHKILKLIQFKKERAILIVTEE